jgi:hypothetical protein
MRTSGFHFIPTYFSWLNKVEVWFSDPQPAGTFWRQFPLASPVTASHRRFRCSQPKGCAIRVEEGRRVALNPDAQVLGLMQVGTSCRADELEPNRDAQSARCFYRSRGRDDRR